MYGEYEVYKAKPRDEKNLYGQIKTENVNGPCCFCISAGGIANLTNVFGTTKICMEIGGVWTRGDTCDRFELGTVPVEYLSLTVNTQNKDKTEEERTDQFVTQYLLPLIANNGRKIDCTQAMKNMRNINMMSYCDGTLVVQAIERNLLNKMQELGYTDEECKKILSQVCVFPIATNQLKGIKMFTYIAFRDFNDIEVKNEETREKEEEELSKSASGVCIIEHADNEMECLFSGNGIHGLGQYKGTRKCCECVDSKCGK